MSHINKGCLVRPREDIRSDGSRQEGSHKGWNGLQRSFASGIEMFTALSHDFVLRRNCRIANNSKKPSQFVAASNGTHHVRLVDHNAALWNDLLAREKGKGAAIDASASELPRLLKVASGETFGLVASKYSSSYKGLLEIKEEIGEEDQPLIEERSSDAFDAAEMFKTLNIDPSLAGIPLSLTGSQLQPILLGAEANPNHLPHASDHAPSTSTIVDLTTDEAPAAGSKRKSVQPEGQAGKGSDSLPSAFKRVRIHAERTTDNVSEAYVRRVDDHYSP